MTRMIDRCNSLHVMVSFPWCNCLEHARYCRSVVVPCMHACVPRRFTSTAFGTQNFANPKQHSNIDRVVSVLLTRVLVQKVGRTETYNDPLDRFHRAVFFRLDRELAALERFHQQFHLSSSSSNEYIMRLRVFLDSCFAKAMKM